MSRGRGLIYFWISVLILAMGNSVIAKLGILGANNLINGRNPISFCNVLFTGNVIAGLTLWAIYWKEWNKTNLKKITLKMWITMAIMSILIGFLYPTLIYIGLMVSSVINVILISTLDIPLALVFGWLISNEHPRPLAIIAALFALVGILVTLWLHQAPFLGVDEKKILLNLGDNPLSHFLATTHRAGEFCVALAVLINASTDEYNRKKLLVVPMGIYGVLRMLVGTFIFFWIVLYMMGWVHFVDIVSPFLWEWMVVYGVLIVAAGLYFWFKSLPKTTPADFSLGNAFTPLAGLVFAYLIVNELPDRGQIIGGILILIGILVGLSDNLRHLPKKKKWTLRKTRGFTGV